jgi:hypothetical protein
MKLIILRIRYHRVHFLFMSGIHIKLNFNERKTSSIISSDCKIANEALCQTAETGINSESYHYTEYCGQHAFTFSSL